MTISCTQRLLTQGPSKYRPLNLTLRWVDERVMEASSYAFAHGIRRTRAAFDAWNERPWPVLAAWVGGSLAAALLLLGAVWVIAALSQVPGTVQIHRPPFQV